MFERTVEACTWIVGTGVLIAAIFVGIYSAWGLGARMVEANHTLGKWKASNGMAQADVAHYLDSLGPTALDAKVSCTSSGSICVVWSR